MSVSNMISMENAFKQSQTICVGNGYNGQMQLMILVTTTFCFLSYSQQPLLIFPISKKNNANYSFNVTLISFATNLIKYTLHHVSSTHIQYGSICMHQPTHFLSFFTFAHESHSCFLLMHWASGRYTETQCTPLSFPAEICQIPKFFKEALKYREPECHT